MAERFERSVFSLLDQGNSCFHEIRKALECGEFGAVLRHAAPDREGDQAIWAALIGQALRQRGYEVKVGGHPWQRNAAVKLKGWL